MREENFARITFVEVDYEADDLRIDPLILAEIQSNVQVILSFASLRLILAIIISHSLIVFFSLLARFVFSILSQSLHLPQIIFNVVASVKFNERLKSAVGINLLATRKIIELANRIKTLKSFLHISTLFVNCNRSENEEIGERIYDHQLDYHQLICISRGNIEVI